jgi:hypothetical protein
LVSFFIAIRRTIYSPFLSVNSNGSFDRRDVSSIRSRVTREYCVNTYRTPGSVVVHHRIIDDGHAVAKTHIFSYFPAQVRLTEQPLERREERRTRRGEARQAPTENGMKHGPRQISWRTAHFGLTGVTPPPNQRCGAECHQTLGPLPYAMRPPLNVAGW